MEYLKETFDISGKVDTNNPIYRFYEHRVQRVLKRFRPTMQRITDPQGVTWLHITPSGRTIPLDRRTPSCSHYILDIPPWA